MMKQKIYIYKKGERKRGNRGKKGGEKKEGRRLISKSVPSVFPGVTVCLFGVHRGA